MGATMQGPGGDDELAAGGASVCRGDGDFAAELIGLVCLALGNALDLWRMPRIELPAPIPTLLPSDLVGAGERRREGLFQPVIVLDAAADIAANPAQTVAQESQLLFLTLKLTGMRIAPRHNHRTLADPQIALAQDNPLLAGERIELFQGAHHQFGIGRMGDVFRHDRGIHGDAGQLLRLQGTSIQGHAQAFFEQAFQAISASIPAQSIRLARLTNSWRILMI